MSDQLTLFVAATHASPFPPPGSDKARLMTATSGRKLIGSWVNSGPLGSCVKMLLGTSAWASTSCFLTWKAKATPANRLLFQLAPSAPRIDGTGFGLWPTAMAGDTAERTNEKYLARRERLGLPNTLAMMVARVELFPTPQSSDDRDRGNLSNPAIQRRLAMGKQLNLSMVASPESGALNPAWVEALMGFPPGWTDLGSAE